MLRSFYFVIFIQSGTSACATVPLKFRGLHCNLGSTFMRSSVPCWMTCADGWGKREVRKQRLKELQGNAEEVELGEKEDVP